MAKAEAGRFTAAYSGSLVVFIIGMSVNRWWAVHRWLPVFRAMGPMIAELYKNKELGFLDMQFALSPKGPILIQYWRSYDQLEHYARHGAKHLKAWRDFNTKAAKSHAVGVFHETYIVDEGKYESVYVNMPKFGLGRVAGLAPATGPRETARRRLGGQNEPAVAE
ncbi:DUF4188 domain-containing protein [Paenibacillus sp.]|uniref:DUF4188 domain-containing protein n=1 Tax=Paenibacillus sp. TaxID=58172 RepID=UPI002D54719F|nr:DUF4188 domain-containing protein [Paenibacillus sp.]HZG87421.1 DUF4188 domain-containing protein [Paenibacillus sp.]